MWLRRVLVEQRVEEDRLELADAAVAVDERDLAQADGALVARGVAAQDVGALVGVDAHGAAVAELDLEALG